MSCLSIENLSVKYSLEQGELKAVDSVSLDVQKGEIFGLVGESGAGKSTVGRAIMRMIQSPGTISEGSLIYDDRDLLNLSNSEIRSIRGNDVSMIFQEPKSALNPVLTVGKQLRRAYHSHHEQKKSEEEVIEILVESLEKVQIPNPRSRLSDYPSQFSGGMAQRVLIAMALINEPNILIADEPTSNLDVTIEANILNLLSTLCEEEDLTVVLITHNMGVVAHHCDRVGIMYAGKLIEEGKTEEIFESPSHPYTMNLINCVPRPDQPSNGGLDTIEGTMPTPIEMPDACYYAPRCEYADDVCWLKEPQSEPVEKSMSQESACHFRDQVQTSEISDNMQTGEVSND